LGQKIQSTTLLSPLEFIQQSETGKKIISFMEKYIPLKRLGKPEDIAPIVAFLSSDLYHLI
jgi:2-hydroxycyclohexanecarboxyl-CoA dehydrogenase